MHPRILLFMLPVTVCQNKTNNSHTTYPRFHYITSVATFLGSKSLTLTLELGFWSPRSVFGAFDRLTLHITTGIRNPHRTLNSRHAYLYQSAFHDVGSFNPRGHVDHEGVECASRSESLGFHCYRWCTYEGTYWSRARVERRQVAQSLGLVVACNTPSVRILIDLNQERQR
jgi:hypothetical protein